MGVFRDRAIEESLIEAARIGVAVLRKFRGRIAVETKGPIDLVTEADRQSERKVFQYLERRHPGHTFIGEETWKGEMSAPPGFAWLLDPLDGTTNYAHNLDHYAFSLGVLRDGGPVAGIIVDPERDHTYRAIKGRGAFRNRKRLHVSNKANLSDCLMATGFPYNRRERLPELLPALAAFLKRTHGIRRFGVAALDLAYVAAGQFDGYYEPSLKPWDVAAGILLVEEAGGRVTDYEGRLVDLFNPSIVAANPVIQPIMLDALREARRSGLSGIV